MIPVRRTIEKRRPVVNQMSWLARRASEGFRRHATIQQLSGVRCYGRRRVASSSRADVTAWALEVARTVMGIYDRDYYRREGQSFLGSLTERGTVCKWLIGVNVICFM